MGLKLQDIIITLSSEIDPFTSNHTIWNKYKFLCSHHIADGKQGEFKWTLK